VRELAKVVFGESAIYYDADTIDGEPFTQVVLGSTELFISDRDMVYLNDALNMGEVTAANWENLVSEHEKLKRRRVEVDAKFAALEVSLNQRNYGRRYGK
jgi:hypothetical protein